MKKSKFTGEQIVCALMQAEVGVGIEKLCRKYGISAATLLSVAGQVRRAGGV